MPALALVAEVLKQPSFDAKEFDLLKESQLTQLDASRSEPRAVVSREMRRFYGHQQEGHPRYTATLDQALSIIRDMKLEDIKAFHQRFYGGNQLQVSVVGDFELKDIKKSLGELFEGWVSSDVYQRIPDTYDEKKPIDQIIQTPDKESAAMVALTTLPVGENHVDAPALQLGVYMFGGGFLNSRLANRLRGDDGLSYSVRAWLSASSHEDVGSLSMYAIFAPQNLDAVKLGFNQELQKVLDQGFTSDELKAAKSGIIQKAKVDRSENGGLAHMLMSNLFLGRTMQWDKAFEEKVMALTPEDVHKAFKKHIKPGDFSFIVAGDIPSEK